MNPDPGTSAHKPLVSITKSFSYSTVVAYQERIKKLQEKIAHLEMEMTLKINEENNQILIKQNGGCNFRFDYLH